MYSSERARHYYQKNRDGIRAKRTAYYRSNREALIAKVSAYAKNSPERKAYQRAYNLQEKRKVSARNVYLKHEFGITVAQYDKLFVLQKGVCAICAKPPQTKRLAVDHDHKTKRVRGLLCYRCNRLYVGIHTIETAQKVLSYLQKENFDGRNL